MNCHICKQNLNTKYLAICETCKTVKWSRRFINSNSIAKEEYPVAKGEYRSHITSVLSNVDFIYNKNQKYFANYSETFFANDERARTAYAIRLNQSWEKKGIKYDYYVGGTGKHPAIRYLEHLIPKYSSNLQRANSIKYLDEFVVKEGSNHLIQYELEEKLSKKYCNKGFYVYSDKHMCTKCQ